MKQQTKKRKGSGSKTCPFFMMEVVGWKAWKLHRGSYRSPPKPTDPTHLPNNMDEIWSDLSCKGEIWAKNARCWKAVKGNTLEI